MTKPLCGKSWACGWKTGDSRFDFAANRLPPPWGRTYPIGLDTEVCTFAALERAWQEAKEPQHREHVMPYFYEGVELKTENRKLHHQCRTRILRHTAQISSNRNQNSKPQFLEAQRKLGLRCVQAPILDHEAVDRVTRNRRGLPCRPEWKFRG